MDHFPIESCKIDQQVDGSICGFYLAGIATALSRLLRGTVTSAELQRHASTVSEGRLVAFRKALVPKLRNAVAAQVSAT